MLEHELIQIERLDLAGREILESYTFEEIESIYNGAGPDSWPKTARSLLTTLMQLFNPSIVIHDVQFENSDGTRKSFEYTVDCWTQNCRKIFDEKYPLLTWRMLRLSYRAARSYWYTVMISGNKAVSGNTAYEAWLAAYKRKQ